MTSDDRAGKPSPTRRQVGSVLMIQIKETAMHRDEATIIHVDQPGSPRRARSLVVLATSLAAVALPLAGCSSVEDSPVAHNLRAAESRNPPDSGWLPVGSRGPDGKPWAGCSESYKGWC